MINYADRITHADLQKETTNNDQLCSRAVQVTEILIGDVIHSTHRLMTYGAHATNGV